MGAAEDADAKPLASEAAGPFAWGCRGDGLALSPRKLRSGCGSPSGGKAATVLRMYSCSLCLLSRFVESLGCPNVLDSGKDLRAERTNSSQQGRPREPQREGARASTRGQRVASGNREVPRGL
eukprot:scaffold109196_cov29-Tisochrysis_lutea.AAC.2